MRIIGTRERYALREVIFLGLMPDVNKAKYVNGMEVLGVLSEPKTIEAKRENTDGWRCIMKNSQVMFSMLLLYLFVSGRHFPKGRLPSRNRSEVKGKPEVTPGPEGGRHYQGWDTG